MEKSKSKCQHKILIVGEAKIGKTSIVSRYCQDKFSDKYKPTFGADFLTKDIDIDGETAVLQIWDTAGKERFQSLNTGYL